MQPFVVPTHLRAAALAEDRGEWLETLPRALESVTEARGLRVGAPYEPGGHTAWVAPVEDARGRPMVLKLGWKHPEAAAEGAGLRAWGGDGAVLLLDELDVGHDTIALLLERCEPGSALATLDEPEQDTVIAELLRRLWITPPPGQFRPLSEMVDQWAEEFEAKVPVDPSRLDPGLARAGIELWRTLPTTAERTVLLVTDLHAGNVLAAGREPWLMIDPKPFVGDPHYDLTQHLLNCRSRMERDPLGLIERVAELAQLDATRLQHWMFARCVVESDHWPGSAEIAAALAPP